MIKLHISRSGKDTPFEKEIYMDLLQAMRNRHSVRSYTNKPIEGEVKEKLSALIAQCNGESGLHIQLVLDEPNAFDSMMAHYGKFSSVRNYIVMAGKKTAELEETCGYYGEKIVLYAQTLGLNTCWVAMTYSKGKAVFQLDQDEKVCLVIAVGYGETEGTAHKVKSRERVMKVQGTPPEWFIRGINAALLAPTAMNQQKFVFSLDGNTVSAKAGMGFYSRIDLGIAKYHFEIGAGTENFQWGKTSS